MNYIKTAFTTPYCDMTLLQALTILPVLLLIMLGVWYIMIRKT